MTQTYEEMAEILALGKTRRHFGVPDMSSPEGYSHLEKEGLTPMEFYQYEYDEILEILYNQ